jgi:threonylcarbamoyladenosine tRNA methylthiotransferase MtaB
MYDTYHVTGKTFSVITLGCRVNHYESEALASMLENRGAFFVPAATSESPDIVVVVTCSITSVADAKTRKILRRTRRENPTSVLVACACWVQSATAEDAASVGVDILVGNRVKSAIPDALENWFESKNEFKEIKIDVTKSAVWDKLSLDRPRMLTRAFIKVQDGCDRECSYCAVPSLRGAHVSRDPEEVISEISRVAANGTKEIIITGIQLGSYEYGGTTLAELIRKITPELGVKRLRLGSLEPFGVTGELLRAASESDIFCRHLHLPLQSGDDGVLATMRRGYDRTDFARIVDMARKYLGDDVHISTDLIVGFPGESDRAFENSLNLLKELSIGKIHVFPFSLRNGTEASYMSGEVPRQLVKERVARAIKLSEELLAFYARRRVGWEDSILIEEAADGIVSGWSTHYLRVYSRAQSTENYLKGNELDVRPKISIGSILLCEDVEVSKIVVYPDE